MVEEYACLIQEIKNLEVYINIGDNLSDSDLLYISRNFVRVCNVSFNINKIFEVMTEPYFKNVIANVLSEYINEFTNAYEPIASNKVIATAHNNFKVYGNQYFSKFSVETFIKYFLEITKEKDYYMLMKSKIYKFLNFLDYYILGYYNITLDNNILDQYILNYSDMKIDSNIIAHYILKYDDRFIRRYDLYKNATCLENDYIMSKSNYSNHLYYDINSSKYENELTTQNMLLLIDFAIKKNYYDIFIDCYNNGCTLTEEHFLTHIENFCDYYQEYNLKNPYKILEHFCKIEKFQLKINQNMSPVLKSSLANITHLISDITFDDIKKLYNDGYYINVSKYNYNKDQLDILYNILFKNYVVTEKHTITIFVDDIGMTQHIFREMFKKSTITQIKKYMKLHKLKIDIWCIDNAFISRNTKVTKLLMEKNIYPSLNISLLILEKKKYSNIKGYLLNNIMANYDLNKNEDLCLDSL